MLEFTSGLHLVLAIKTQVFGNMVSQKIVFCHIFSGQQTLKIVQETGNDF